VHTPFTGTDPAAQVVSLTFLPLELLAMDPKHALGDTLLMGEDWPVGHLVHSKAAAREKEPTGQKVHTSFTGAEPAAQTSATLKALNG
jgi:hypothetical protein